VESINVFRDKPAGHLRLTVPRPAAKEVIERSSRISHGASSHHSGVVTDSALADIVRDRFDAGIRPGHRIEQDMIAVRIGDDARPTIVASRTIWPSILGRRCRRPREHNCFVSVLRVE